MTNFGLKNLHYRKALYRSAVAVVAIAVVGVVAPQQANAQQEAAQRTFEFNLPAQALARSVSQIASTTGLQVMFDGTDTTEIRVSELKGRMTVDQALARVLSGSGLTYQYVRPGVITLLRASTEGNGDGERVLGAVRVEGAQGAFNLPGATAVNGINGSRDVTATEGTGSYTTGAMTIGSKMAATIKEVPRAVSVVTSQQMEDQNLTSVTDAMKALPGVIAQDETLGQPTFYSRGFQITAFQVDGGAPMTTRVIGSGNYEGLGSFAPNMDMSLYDHVELVRGAAGTFNGFGNPGGVVNLVRKKPLDHNQLLLEFQLGSFNLHRASADITGPLAFDGKLRGRLIATHQDNDYFYSIANNNKNLVSATLEYDLTPTTLLSAGASYDDQQMMPWERGLMRDMQGILVSVPRDTCLCRPGGNFNTKTTEYFGQIEQKISDSWEFNYKITYAEQDQDNKYGFIYGVYNADPAKNQTYASSWEWRIYNQRRVRHEVIVKGAFDIFGLNQKILIGVNHSISDGNGGGYYGSNKRVNAAVDPLNYNPYDYYFDGNWYSNYYVWTTAYQTNAFASADIQLLPNVHLITGISAVKNNVKINQKNYCNPGAIGYNGECSNINDYNNEIIESKARETGKTRISWPPSASLRYDLSDGVSIYGSYADIRIEQAAFYTIDNKPLDPILGENFEGGIKWLTNDKKLNVNLSAYYIHQKGFAEQRCHDEWMEEYPELDDYVAQRPALCTRAGFDGTASVNAIQCCYISNPDRRDISYGVDLEINGEIRRGWQISASYTFNKSFRKDPTVMDRVTGDYNPLLSFSPRHLYKFWTSYTFDDASRFRGLSVYAGFQGQSETFISDTYCSQPVNAIGNCPVARTPVHYTSPGWVVVNVGGSYQVSQNMSLQLNVDNLFDKSYLAMVGGLGNGSYYGSPRNIAVTMRAKF
jgi:outer-membrane receptor for ferric coprogen and ferric-rhodotorulic acid